MQNAEISPDVEKVRMQVGLCDGVANALAAQAKELQRTQAWVGWFLVGLALGERKAFGDWLRDRVVKAGSYQKWIKTVGGGREVRVEVSLEKSVADELETMAVALNQGTLKLAGLMIEHGLEEYHKTLEMMKNPFVKRIRRFVHGKREEEGRVEAGEDV